MEKEILTVLDLERTIQQFGNKEETNWRLRTNRQDIEDVMLGWNLETQVPVDDVGCLFVRYLENLTIETVYYCESVVPYHWKKLWRLK